MPEPPEISPAVRRRDRATERAMLWSWRDRQVDDPPNTRDRRSPLAFLRGQAAKAADPAAARADRPPSGRRPARGGPPAGRLYLHAFMGALVAGVVGIGGFHRPTDGLEGLVGTDPANLPLQTRLLLGPRVALIEPRDSLLRPQTATTLDAAPVMPVPVEVQTYVVQVGDTIWDIGARFNVGMYSVLWSNDLGEDDVVRPGQELRIPPVPGVAHLVKPVDTLDAIATRYKIDPIAIVDANGLKPGEPLPADRWLVVPGGELPIVVRPDPPARPVAPVTRAPAPAAARPAPARPAAPAVATGRLQWPTRGSITSYFSGWHPGIDIAAPFGTSISAADAGRVVYAGWDRNGYGNRIIVNHGNGVTTTYSHLSAFLVQVGQSISKGQVIARMGSTGNSSGPHLHFEILRNGGFINPLNNLS